MKFMIYASYSAEGAKGVLKSGSATSRKNVTEAMVNGLGGTMECYYYVTNCDAYAICNLPDASAAAAIALAIKASGMGSATITLLLETEEVDRATQLTVKYSHSAE